MNYKGTIIEESLENTSALENCKILETKVEQVTERHKTPWLQQWTLHTVEISEKKADKIAQGISKALETKHTAWYADFKNDTYHYVIFPNKIFKVDLNDSALYKEAKKYGISLGIPEYQVDFAPDVQV